MDTPKFKPGDKVRVTKAVGEAEVGTILTIRAPYYDTGWRFNEVAYYLEDKHIELVEDGPSNPAVKFPVKSDGGSTGYYTLPKWATELRHLIAFKKMSFNVGNIFKAAYRLGEKSGTDLRYDLNKIIFFAQSELEELDRLEGKL